MTVRITLNNDSWTRIGAGESDILATIESGGARIHVGDDQEPPVDAPGHFIGKNEPFNGALLAGEVVWARGKGVLIVTPGENNVPA